MMGIFFHTDTPITPPAGGTPSTSVLEGFATGDRVGNPLYDVVGEHALAALVLVLAPLLLWLGMRLARRVAGDGDGRIARFLTRFDAAPLSVRFTAAALATSALVHAALVFGHEPSGYTVLYALGALLLGLAATWVVAGTRRTTTVTIVVGSVVTFWFLGAPADQVGIAAKAIELWALALMVAPGRRRMATAGVVALVALTGVAAWIGAFATVGADGGHHGGEFPEPGTVVPYIDRLEATHEEFDLSEELYTATVHAVQKYQDVAVAEAAGYQVGTIVGVDHHAQNPAYIGDGRILDPERPESLIYAAGPDGPVLVGIMFEMDGIGDVGPRPAGPIMVWHSHENVCFGVVPPGLAGLESPFGVCPIGSINIPITGDMLHAWILPGVPVEDHWGHLEDGWIENYLAHSQR